MSVLPTLPIRVSACSSSYKMVLILKTQSKVCFILYLRTSGHWSGRKPDGIVEIIPLAF